MDRARVEDDFIGVRSIWQETCESCNEPYWNGADKKHITQVNHDRFCPSCLDSEGVNPCLRCGEPHEGSEDDFCENCMAWIERQP